MRNLYLCQVNWSNCAGNTLGHWLPYSVASLWAYAQQNPIVSASFVLKEILFQREALDQLLERIEEPAVFGFSTYLWTEKFNLALASRVKEAWPECLIVFGGPQLPHLGTPYLRDNPFIDILVHSEGEEVFSSILTQASQLRPDYRLIRGCTIRHGQEIIANEPSPRIRDLAKLPSPYLEGVFDTLLDNHPNVEWNAVIETNRGCPYHCTFCDWGTLTYSKVVKTERSRTLDEIEWLSRHKISYVLPADANFGIFPDRDDELIEHFVRCKQTFGYPNAVGMSFAKNSNLKILEMAEKLHKARLLKAMTLSAQSMSSDVLSAIKRRNLATSDFSFLLRECERRGIPTYTELILGLPLETYDSWRSGLCHALECGQHNQLESWLLELLPNAPLASKETMQEYGVRAVRMKNYCFVFDAQVRDEIAEEADIVVETSTMSEKDMVAALGFSMLIYNFHAYGWTQAVSRTLRNLAGLSFLEFYGSLESWIQANPSTVIGQEYRATTDAFQRMIDTGDYIVDRELLGINVGAVPIGLRSQGFLHLSAEEVLDEIGSFVRHYFHHKVGDILPELMTFQGDFVTRPNRTYPYQRHFCHDFLNVVRSGEGVGEGVEYAFDLTFPYETAEDYILKIYSKKKQGFGKTEIKRIEPRDANTDATRDVERIRFRSAPVTALATSDAGTGVGKRPGM